MPNRRIAMRRIREILRLHFDCGLRNEKVASALKTTKAECL